MIKMSTLRIQYDYWYEMKNRGKYYYIAINDTIFITVNALYSEQYFKSSIIKLNWSATCKSKILNNNEKNFLETLVPVYQPIKNIILFFSFL